jgi:predicted DNA-binding transcriptional regulator AlpA
MSAVDDSIYLTTHQLAERTGIASSTWQKRRLSGDGPRYVKAGRSVLYRWQDVESWLLQHTRTSTSDAA